MPVGGKEPYNWPSPLTELARSQAWRVQSGHLHLLIWQETQMEGKKQAFFEHLSSARLHAGVLTPGLILIASRTTREGMLSSFI